MSRLLFVLRRIVRHWQIFLTVSLGVILATGLLTSAPLLIDAVVNFGLSRALMSPDPLTGNVRVSTRVPPDSQVVETVDAAVRSALDQSIADLIEADGTTPGIVRSVETYWLYPWLDDGLVDDQRVNLRLYEDVASHVTFVDGRWPAVSMLSDDRLSVVSVVIGEEMANAYGLQVGTELPLSFKDDEESPSIWMRVAGIVRPLDAGSPYWFGMYGPLRAETNSLWTAQYNALIPEDDFYRIAETWFPRSDVDLSWHVRLDSARLAAADIGDVRQRLLTLQETLRGLPLGEVAPGRVVPRILMQTTLPDLLATFEQRITVVRAPLYLLTAEIVLLALYYVVMVAALAVRQVEREIVTLGSRGASRRQIVTIQLTEAALLSGLAFLCGPVMGAFLIRLLASYGPLADVATSAWRVELTRDAWLAAGTGAVASLMGLLLPVGAMLKRTIVTQQQEVTRAARVPWWQRYYLDVFILVAGMIFLWRLQLYGSIVGGETTRPQLDWLLLLSPLALLVGTATILLRLFPLVLRGLAALTGMGRGLLGTLATWPSARNPGYVAQLVLLLTLAMALGILSTGLNATLDVSEQERAAYATGSDARLTVNGFVSTSTLEEMPGVGMATNLWRGIATADLQGTYPRFEVLAVDPSAMATIATYREDFADQPVEELLALLAVPPAPSETGLLSEVLSLPGQPSEFGVWIWAPPDWASGLPQRPRMIILGDSNHERIAIRVKLQSAENEFITAQLQQTKAAGCPSTCPKNAPCEQVRLSALIPDYYCPWRYYSTPLPVLPDAAYPLTLESFWFQNRARARNANSSRAQGMSNILITLAMDDITVVDAITGEVAIVEDFENPMALWTLDSGSTRFRASGGLSGSARQDVMPFFSRSAENLGMRLFRIADAQPVPALVSQAFLDTTHLNIGDTFRAWVASLPPVTFRVEGVLRYFPTLYENMPMDAGMPNAGYIVTVRDLVLPRLNQVSSRSINANEVWLDTGEGTAGAVLTDATLDSVPGATQSWTAEVERQTLKAYPMTLGLRSVTFFGYTMTSLLSLVGFGTYFYMSARQRVAMYGILRSMGLAPLQLYGSLVLEQVVLILWGLGLGTGLGILLNQLVLPDLPIALGDRPPVPPFIPMDDWQAVGQLYIILTGAFFLVLGVAVIFLWRSKLHQALRIGQE